MKKLRYISEYILLLLLLGLAKSMSARRASAFGGWVGRKLGPRIGATRKAESNVRKAFPDMPEDQVKDTVFRMWDNLGRICFEYVHLRHIATRHTDVIGTENLNGLKDKAVIFVSGHLANWEIMPPALMIHTGFEMIPMYRAPNNPYVDDLLNKARSSGGRLETIPKTKSGTRMLVKALKENKKIGMLIDQKYNEGVAADFFGHPAMSFTAYAQLAKKTDCVLVPLTLRRKEGIQFELEIQAPISVEGLEEHDIIDRCHHMLEDAIRREPGQWLWLHRRWDSNKLKQNRREEK